MFSRRRTLNQSTWAVIAAFVLSTLGMAPFGLHAHTGVRSFHTDFCRSIALQGHANSSLPLPAQQGSHAADHCNDCAGCAGSVAAPSPPIAPWLAIARASDVVVIALPNAARHDKFLSAAPRGPPLPV